MRLSKIAQVSLLFLFFSSLLAPHINAQIPPAVSQVSDNRASYIGSQIPKYKKLEITFQITTMADNFYIPYSSVKPAGVYGSGVSVTGIFTAPGGQTFNQPGFYYQEFLNQVKGNNEWFYPDGNYSWKIRFAPHMAGIWQYKIRVRDSFGTEETAPASFTVSNSSSHGFNRTSPDDPRYFEFDDGTYFPGLGFNLNAGNIDFDNPVLGNNYEFEGMNANNIQLSRFWLSQ